MVQVETNFNYKEAALLVVTTISFTQFLHFGNSENLPNMTYNMPSMSTNASLCLWGNMRHPAANYPGMKLKFNVEHCPAGYCTKPLIITSVSHRITRSNL